MKFWDSSALSPLLMVEADSAGREQLFAGDLHIVVWYATRVECTGAVMRKLRNREITAHEGAAARVRLAAFSDRWQEIGATTEVSDRAVSLLKTHPLRAADALQLAAALAACGGDPASLDFVCADARLAEAARREGFTVIP